MSHSSAGRLKSAALDFSDVLTIAREHWQDQKAEEFQKQRIAPILRSVETACLAMDEMAQIVAQMQRECGPIREE
jgi:hypothetical protein